MGSKVHFALEDFGFAFHVARITGGARTHRDTKKGKETKVKSLSVIRPIACQAFSKWREVKTVCWLGCVRQLQERIANIWLTIHPA